MRNYFEDIGDIQQATREELTDYLESWGFQVYDDEETIELRIAALENFETEGPGFGPIALN